MSENKKWTRSPIISAIKAMIAEEYTKSEVAI
jgi:hypothetical protein